MNINNYPEMTYSYSRQKELNACPRRYFYNYYLSAGGWRKDADEKNKQAYRLKKLQPLNSVVGVAIHTAITQRIINPNSTNYDFKKLVNKIIRESHRNSLTKRDEWFKNPNLFNMMQEVYYYGEIEPQVRQKVIEKIDACVAHVESCKSLLEIAREDTNIASIDELQEFAFDNYKTYIKIDALYQTGGEYKVVDWKTSKGNDLEVEQLLLYVFFVHKMCRIPVESIEARLEYLVTGDCASYRFTNYDMEMAEEIVMRGVCEMRNYLFDKDKNIPLPEIYFQQNKSSKCRNCNYKEICFGDTLEKFAEEIITTSQRDTLYALSKVSK